MQLTLAAVGEHILHAQLAKQSGVTDLWRRTCGASGSWQPEPSPVHPAHLAGLPDSGPGVLAAAHPLWTLATLVMAPVQQTPPASQKIS